MKSPLIRRHELAALFFTQPLDFLARHSGFAIRAATAGPALE